MNRRGEEKRREEKGKKSRGEGEEEKGMMKREVDLKRGKDT